MTRSIFALFALALLWAAPNAFATAMHDRTTIKPIKQKGEVVGFKLTTLLKPEGYGSVILRIGNNNYDAFRLRDVQAALDKAKADLAADPTNVVLQGYAQNAQSAYDNLAGWPRLRADIAERKSGYTVVDIPYTMKSNTPEEFSVDILYADHPGLVPGGPIDVFTAWFSGNDAVTGTYSASHVWGRLDDNRSSGVVLTTPAPAPPAAASTAAAAPAARLRTKYAPAMGKRSAAAAATKRRASARPRR